LGRLSGKIALVSGGSRGMGAAHARATVANDGKVVIGDDARFIRLDVTKAEDWKAAVALAITEFGGLNVRVNNAGIVTFATLEDMTEAQWNTILGINLTGLFLGIKASDGALKASAPASIINISSTAGFIGTPGLHGYVASMFGVRGLTKAVTAKLGSSRGRANSTHPGGIRTSMSAGFDISKADGALARIGEPEDVFNLVVYLASDESSFSTGSEFVVDGGQLASTGPVN